MRFFQATISHTCVAIKPPWGAAITRGIFSSKIMQKIRKVPDLFLFFEKALHEVTASGLQLSFNICWYFVHYKVDNSLRRTVWRGTDCFALRSNYLQKNLYKADISIKWTVFLYQWCPLYRDFTVVQKLGKKISKIGKKCTNFGEKCPDYGHLWVKFLILNAILKSFQEKKPNQSALIPRKLPCPKNVLVTRLQLVI